MPRRSRIQYKGAWYHVFNRGISKKTIYFSDSHYFLFIELLGKITKKYNVEIHAFCLMPNHYHLLIHTPDGNLSKAMQYFLSIFAKRINDDINADGSVFRDRYKSILIDSTTYLLQLTRYIHLNPVEAQISSSAKTYKWSSYTAYTAEVTPKY
jgi:putative transposase